MNIDGEEFNMHSVLFGRSGSGRSLILERFAKENNISYEEAVKMSSFNSSDNHDQEPESFESKELRDIKSKQLMAVKLAYWENSESESEFDNFYDRLSNDFNVNSPTKDQVKSLFMLMPSDIVGLGISWGFSDSELRDRLSDYVESNKDMLKKELGEI